MKKIFLIILLLNVITSNSFAQKADTEKKKVKITIPKSDFYKNIKTYNIIIQGDDTWDKKYADKNKMTYEKNTTKNTIEDYTKKDTINPDVSVLMGYKGPTYKKSSNGQFVLDGDFKYLVLGKNNEIIYEKGANATMYSPTFNGKAYQSLTNDLNNIAYKYLNDNNIISVEKEYSINYGIFEKVEEFPELVEFNTKTTEFLGKIEANTLDKNYLTDLEKFYLGYIGKEYKKLKVKDYNKVVYLNLSLTALFLSNFDKSIEYLENAKQGAGMMSMWPTYTKEIIDGFVTVNSSISGAKVANLSYDSAYQINIDGTVTQSGRTQTGKLKVDRFPNLAEGSILNDNDPTEAKVWIYKDNGEVDFIKVDDKTSIKTNDGVELIFIPYNNKFILVEKTNDSCYKKFESSSAIIYCKQGDKYVIKK